MAIGWIYDPTLPRDCSDSKKNKSDNRWERNESVPYESLNACRAPLRLQPHVVAGYNAVASTLASISNPSTFSGPYVAMPCFYIRPNNIVI